MRFIDIERLEELEDWPPGTYLAQQYSPQQWRERLRKAEEELHAAPDSATRNKIFSKYSDLWSQAKYYFRLHSHDKCWYCETSTSGFTGDIDHYRPKGRVAESPSHQGYWWLAFEWRNWRFVCRYCNSLNKDPETGRVGGKADHFPLLHGEAQRITSPDDYEYYEELLCEDPKLLDPTEPGDSDLITFTSEGLPIPVEQDTRLDKYERARASIEIYHLDSTRLKNRRKQVFANVKGYIEEYRRSMRKWEKEHDHFAYDRARKAARKLGRMIAKDAEYSMTTIAYLQDYFQRHPDCTWITTLLTSPSDPVYPRMYVPKSGVESNTPDEVSESS